MADSPVTSAVSVSIDGFTEAQPDVELRDALFFMFEQHGLAETLVGGILELLPDPAVWRLTVTADVVETVNRLSERGADNSYSTDRGAGHVGAVTLPRKDGTFDIVISAHALFATREDVADVEELIAHATAAAEHMSRHEAGHAALRLRGEDADAYKGVEGLSATDAVCRKPLAAHVDDNRIEQYTARHALAPLHQVDHLADAIAHLRDELNEAKRTWRTGIDEAAYRTLVAANGIIRVLAYLAPELGFDEDGRPRRPEPLPEGWNEYIEASWDAWSRTFHRLRPADEAMTTDELGSVLADLCRMMNAWLRSIGINSGITADGQEFIFWERDRY